MRNTVAAALAVPILVAVIARSIGRRAGVRRLSAVVAVVAVAAIVATSSLRPTPTTATPPTRTTAVDPTAFTTEIRTSESPSAAVSISFATAMDRASVDAALRVTPRKDVRTSWDPTGTVLTVAPVGAWLPGTLYTVTVNAGALDASGQPLERRIRAVFLTRPPVTASIVATAPVADDVAIATAFRVSFSGPIDDSTLSVLIDPEIEGSLRPAPSSTDLAPAFDFVPADPLSPDTAYTVRLAPGALDLEGAAVSSTSLDVRTAAAPAVVRFRPRHGWADVNWRQTLSVRFTEPMDHASTEAAWSATQGSKATPIAGTFRWAENDTVLVFDPKVVLGYSQQVTMTVGTGATSKAGVPLQAAASATFATAKRPVQPPPSGGGSGGGGGGSGGGGGGGGTGGGTWAAVESYYLKLMNCTRTGGWVTSTGSCSSPGGRDVAALFIDSGISTYVARPYAKKLAVNNLCTHFSGGGPDDRLRAAGYTSYIWAENIGCRSGDPYAAVLGSHLYFQSEYSYNGGHYVNLMNAKYDRVGIGVWVYSGRVRLVVDFYHPL